VKTIIAKSDVLNQDRIKKGFSMRRLSKEADIDVVTIHRIETHKTKRVSISTAKKICTALKAEFDELFELTEAVKEGA
jgi:DNA-binding Xre family transcriptional regulator